MEGRNPDCRSVVWPRIGPATRYLLLDNYLTGVAYHWPPGQPYSVPCTWLPSCPCCQALIPRRWKAYSSCLTASLKQRVVEITPVAANGIISTMPDDLGFRCLEISLARGDTGKQAPVQGRALARRDDKTWPKGEFVLEILTKLFRRCPPVAWLTRERLEFAQTDEWDLVPDTL